MGKALNNIDYYDEFGFVTVNGSSNTSEIKWYGYNEWNRSVIKLNSAVNENDGADKFGYTGNEFDGSANWENLSNIDGGDGKQVVKNIPSSRFKYTAIVTGENGAKESEIRENTVTNSVPYCFAKTSTPFEFYYNAQKQNAAMRVAETNGLALYNNIEDSHMPPGNIWNNYIASSYRPGLKDALNGYTSPKIPFKQSSVNNRLESGVDCGGLIYGSEMYESTPYKRLGNTSARDGNRFKSVHDAGGSAEQWEGEVLANTAWDTAYTGSNNLWKVVRIDNLDDLEYSDKLSSVIPGDIVYYVNGSSYHVMMVQSVKFVEGTRKTSVHSISLIESTIHNGLHIFGVSKIRSLDRITIDDDQIGNVRKNWHIGRLKTGE